MTPARALRDVRTYARFAVRLRRFLTSTTTLEEARATVRHRMQRRDEAFLRLLEKGVFGNPRSPYLPLFELARVELGDVRALLRERGLEATLLSLREVGVYVTFEEFKGRQPIIRSGRETRVRLSDFDNPHLHHYYRAATGGSTGAGTRVSTDLDHLAAEAAHYLLTAWTALRSSRAGWPRRWTRTAPPCSSPP